MSIRKITLAAMFIAIGIYLPFLTGQIPQIGRALLPMHLPVLICGFVLGWPYGLLVGFILPLLRSLLYTTPPFPLTAVPMAFELAAYGMITGYLYQKLPRKTFSIYISLLAAMVGGRIVWGGVRFVMLLAGTSITWQMYVSSVLISSIPGIILQIVLVPALVLALQRAGMMKHA